MESHFLLFMALLPVLSLLLVGSNASEPGEKYWHSVLPNTPLPKALQDLFHDQPKKDLSAILKNVSVSHGKQRSTSTEDLSEILKDLSVDYGKPKIASTKDLLEILKHVFLNYGNPRSASTKDLSEILKDLSVDYGKRRIASTKDLSEFLMSASTKDLSEILKDLSVDYGKPRIASTKDLSEILKDLSVDYGKRKIAPTENFSEILKDLSVDYGKSKIASVNYEKLETSSAKNLLEILKGVSKDLQEILKDESVLYGKPKDSDNLQNDEKDIITKGFLEIIEDLKVMHQEDHLPQADEFAKNAYQDRTIFYLYNDLHRGKKMTLLFTNAGNKVDFLPREVAESIPFSTDKVQEILARFAIDPESANAEVVKDTINDCENPPRAREVKYCATSLESLVDQNVARVGTNIRVLSTPEGKKQEYTVLAGAKKIGDVRVIVCHKERYPYAVYYCHEIDDTEVYTVPLMGADGTKLKAVTICHKDTSGWDPDYIAFQILKIKPGPPFCHFLYSDVLVWFQTKDLGHHLMPHIHHGLLNQGLSAM
ncbi:hypothetical protein Tsubulata_033866 [Turnera subulata]|uniref:BURP domain-containing protein n=1 Tax=Turnera subulata TaxID=218843 RepID=A0A9Q0FCK1_9ROSI|nr:hypothetical protein Tsubulata_033866 [Turnera subulata]